MAYQRMHGARQRAPWRSMKSVKAAGGEAKMACSENSGSVSGVAAAM